VDFQGRTAHAIWDFQLQPGAALGAGTPSVRGAAGANPAHGAAPVLPLHDPMRLAEECSILDILTGGRLNVGLGRGVPRDDLKHGLDRDTAQARFEEGIELLRRAWTEDSFTYSGKAWSYVDITCRPRPLQKPHPPIYYGATSPESPTMVARRGHV